MQVLRLTIGLMGMLALALMPVAAQNKADDKVTLKTVKYAGLAETIAQNRGKVILIDIWGHF
jgi:hypothetical protein